MIAKVYIFELKETNDIYAYTTDKKIAKTFLKERNKKCFNHYCLDLNKADEKQKHELSMKIAFDASYKIDKIGVLFDGKNDIPIYMTLQEILDMNDICDLLFDSLTYTYGCIAYREDDFTLKENELKVISELTDFIRNPKVDMKYLEDSRYEIFNRTINSYKVFYNLFGFTLDPKLSIN